MRQGYPQSKEILKTARSAGRILIAIHQNPDMDAAASALSLQKVLRKLGKNAHVICATPASYLTPFLKDAAYLWVIDFATFDFSRYDLLFVLDASTWEYVAGAASPQPRMCTVVIDHHERNTLRAAVKLVDANRNATAEILHQLFSDWGVACTRAVASALFFGLASDTQFFSQCKDASGAFATAAALVEHGADSRFFAEHINSYKLPLMWLFQEFLSRMQFDRRARFVWSAVPYGVYRRFHALHHYAKDIVADLFFQNIENAESGIAMVEIEPDVLLVSFRTRNHVDVSRIAERLGGGGHRHMAGCRLEGAFRGSVGRVLKAARGHGTSR